MSEDARRDTEEARALSDTEMRERIVQLAFHGDRARFDQFVQALRRAIPRDVAVVLRGSVITGRRWADGQPFDADGRGSSDLDLTLVGGDMLKLWREDAFYIPKLHTMPLSDDSPDVAPVFVPLRRALCAIAGRPVNFQATSSLVQYARDVLFDQPYFVLIDREDEDETHRRHGPVQHREERRSARSAAPRDGRRLDDASPGGHAR